MTTRQTRQAGSARRGSTVGDWTTRIRALMQNLWWSWNPDPQRLFAALDPPAWEATQHNPLKTLAGLTPARRTALAAHREFQQLLTTCERQLRDYLRACTWFQRTADPRTRRLRIAYFCAEFAIHESMQQYAGGLGVLAGDHLKSASDLGVPLVAVGLLYRSGYYRQALRPDGTTDAHFPHYDFADWPVQDTGRRIRVPLGRRAVLVRIWQLQVGRVPVYLLDTDLPDNRPADRTITARLYGGDNETRIQQELILGVGGTRALQALGVPVNVFHLNEGHAAFCALERLRALCAIGQAYDRALRTVAASTVFTTHTPVPAGHDRFAPVLVRKYLGWLLDGKGLDRETLLRLGREDVNDRRAPFCMTALALRTSARCNGVSALHGQVSREMWQSLFGAATPAEVPIGHITNGIHPETWLAPEMRPLYERYLRPRWVGAGPEHDWWRRAPEIPAEELWRIRGLLRRRLVQFIRMRLLMQAQRRLGDTRSILAVLDTFDEQALTIGFARRFATYKRAPLIFHQARRLASILNAPQRPVQLVFAGKAHPADHGGQAFARKIYQFAEKAGFRGRVALLEDYDMDIGRALTSGCDVWLNNPLRPQEASGTSGMKPPLHGGLNCSILDGWWPEAYDGHNGWAIGDGVPARTPAAQDRRDAEAIYTLLEREIVPEFYTRDRHGLPRKWLARMLRSMQTVCAQFSTHRMVADYVRLYAGY